MNHLVDLANDHILTLVTFLPGLGAVLLLFFPRRDRDIRWFALLISLLTFIASLHLPWHFDYSKGGFQYELNVPWITTPNIHYHLGADGISIWLVVLTTFLVPLSVLISWTSIKERVKEFFILMLILETAMLGVFVSLDLFQFYFFWEATLIPMALLIGIYGHERRIYAAVKFFMYTMVASVFMLAAMLWLYSKTGSFDFVEIQQAIQLGNVSGFSHAQQWLFLGFFIAFAVKVPLFPFHTWLPDAHVEAPTAGSVLLAGVLLKMGTYGLLRFNLGLFPEAARRNAPWIIALAIIGIIYGALVALVQPNMKKLVAYSSVSHLGFCVLGIFSFTAMGVSGSVYQMLNHGVSTGGLFMLLGMIYERRHTYEIKQYGGLATPMPVFATFFLVITLASAGLPLLNGFVGEFLVLSGAFQAKMIYGILAASGVIWGAWYLLWLYQKTFYGDVTVEANNNLSDLNARERLSLWPIAVMSLVMGVVPMIFLRQINPAVQAALSGVNGGVQAAVPTAHHFLQVVAQVIGR
ncbi:NADH dehydrogenase subunit M [Candidatus Koribacter versatilis Ellin345]|uniref:NADH dehydrogenase subunit M n=1 Tax=Koribacter versatilis (strain Ellin345) TaxID=204669 RepID=Q1IS44_KORVE|nr:NADH-quinone oxidoreductase subunit M [Candidatus Koribacter versatilis]ABF40306.1 NADH dehydrogenase subunit M [Candidatus Koribacter versatilis Ellin345]